MEHRQDNEIPRSASGENKKSLKEWFKKMGFAAFMFFLLKGIAWLVIGYFGLEMLGC